MVMPTSDTWPTSGRHTACASPIQLSSLARDGKPRCCLNSKWIVIPVSDPSTDVAYSFFAGFTQSETSTARCGNSVVVGYNDSGSVFETPFSSPDQEENPSADASYSTNGGASFTDIGPINPGSTNDNFLGGDPS